MRSSSAPFAPSFPIRCLADVRRLEQVPLEQALPVASTYEILRNSAQAFGAKTALTFLPTADLDATPARWSYAQLLAGVHRTANLLHRLGVQPHDAVAVMLPGGLEYHLALWGGEAAGIVQPLNPLLTQEKLAALMNAARAKVLMAWGAEEETGIWAKAMGLRERVPSLKAVLRVMPGAAAPHPSPLPASGEREPLTSTSPSPAWAGEGRGEGGTVPILDFTTHLNQEPADRLISNRTIAPHDIASHQRQGVDGETRGHGPARARGRRAQLIARQTP